MGFCGHCHVHDDYSPLDGAATRNQLSYEAVRKGQTFLGFTNHGRLGGAYEHVDACRFPEHHDNPVEPGKKRSSDERLIPILGIEAYWRPNRHMDLSDEALYGKNGHNWAQHLCLHARSLAGWRTLMRLSSKSWVRRERGGGFFGKPCIDWEMLDDDHEDIVISTACINSPLAHLILAGDDKNAKRWCIDAIDIVGDRNFFFEIMPHDLDAQREVNIGVVNLANELGLPYITSGDVHIAYKDWADTQQVVMMAATRQSFKSQQSKREAGEDVYGAGIDTIYLSSEDELRAMYADNHPDLPISVIDQSMDSTLDFAQRFKPIVFGQSPKMPKAGSDKHVEDTLKGWLKKGKHKRESNWIKDGVTAKEFKQRRKIYEDRIDYEWRVIKGKKQLAYFYLVGDITRWAQSDAPLPSVRSGVEDYFPEHQEAGFKKRPIRLTCRGSAAGCLVSYDIKITNVDPIPHGMLFERFLNPDREGMPDIDIDIESGIGRDLVKEYIRRTQGEDHVADIIAYQTFAPRAVLKAVGDVFDVSFIDTKKATDSIDEKERGLVKIEQDNEILADYLEKNPDVRKHALRLEDMILRDSRHAAGMLITPGATHDYVPTQLGSSDDAIVTAWADRADFPVLSDNGFIKLDVLGVNALRKQQVAIDLIGQYYEEEFEPNDLPAQRDPKAVEQEVLDMFVHGLTAGIFQFGGRGITQLLRHIKPDSITDLTIANALYRPGPVKLAFEYGNRKNGISEVTYVHESAEPVLRETLGVLCFQEQIMELCKQVGNFTGGQADSMRKAVSKLYRIPGDAAQEYMQGFYDIWAAGCYANGLREEDGDTLWRWVLPFGNYAFNRSHAGTYALQAHQDMHIKRHWPRAFYAALLTVEHKPKPADQRDFLKSVLREARIFDIDATKPDINRSFSGWTIHKEKLLYGLVSIKGIGAGAAAEVVESEVRPFDSVTDFITNGVDSSFGADSMEALAKAGAFDSIAERRHLLSKTRKWDEGIAKFDVVMSCGCKKLKTVKSSSKFRLAKDIRLAMIELECRKHEDATAKEWTEQDPYTTVIQWLKDHPHKQPKIYLTPSDDELEEFETDTLFIPMSTAKTSIEYQDFIEERIHSELEIAALPSKPPKKGKLHGGYCSCSECTDAECVVGGELVNIKVITTRNKQLMAFADFAFGVSVYNVTFFPWLYAKIHPLLKRPTLFLVAGHKDSSRGSDQIIAYDIRDVVDIANKEEQQLETVT